MSMSDTTRPEDGDDTNRYVEDSDPSRFAGENARDEAVEPDQVDELALGDDDTRLPWLEGDDEDDDEAGYNSGQVIAFVMIGLIALGLLVGGIWWATSGGPDGELVADGSVIEAPDGPYKEKPENPGGKTFEGTGDSSFAVSEGESRPAQLGKEPAAPKPGFGTVDGAEQGEAADEKSEDKPEAASLSSTQAQGDSSGVGVQVGAYSTQASAEAAWGRLTQQYAVLSGMRYRIVEGKADIGTVYRLQALPADRPAASSLCRKLKAGGLNCNVKN